MSVLSGSRIRQLLALPVDDPDGLCITPMFDPNTQIGEDSVNVCIGNYFLISRSDRIESYKIGKEAVAKMQTLVHVPFGCSLVVPAHKTVLGVLYEYVKLPQGVAAEILTRSSYARLFITIATATWVHPWFRGCLTLEISNTSDVAVAIEPGTPMAQLVFFELDKPAKRPKAFSAFGGLTMPQFPDFERDRAWVSAFAR